MTGDNFLFFTFAFILIASIGYFLDKLNTKEIRSKFYIKLEDYKEKEYIKTEFDLKLESFFNKLAKVIWAILKVVGSLILIGLTIWGMVAFPIAAIIILLILILLK